MSREGRTLLTSHTTVESQEHQITRSHLEWEDSQRDSRRVSVASDASYVIIFFPALRGK
ncbi:hypothetical protein BDZ89DRAFT_1065813 [Hymenopellis radicata]|nr:hypothetical protein BDZ89DRAFT_1065813 [Hymenopellis radicata]